MVVLVLVMLAVAAEWLQIVQTSSDFSLVAPVWMTLQSWLAAAAVAARKRSFDLWLYCLFVFVPAVVAGWPTVLSDRPLIQTKLWEMV